MLRSFAVLAATLIGASAVQAAPPPAWCRNAETRNEHRICDSRLLSALDRQLNVEYRRALRFASPRYERKLRAEQNDWLGERDACRRRRGCDLVSLHRRRIRELRTER